MSDIHILECNKYTDKVRCAFHFDVPVGSNQAGKTWIEVVQAIKQQQTDAGAPTTVVPWLDQVHKDELTAGTIWELDIIIALNAHLTDGEKITILETAYSEEKTNWQIVYQNRYRYWGMDREVV